jgi:hypothetical protein
MNIPSNSPLRPDEPDLSHYKPQYKIDVAQWRKFLNFRNVQLTDNEVHAMADGMIKFFTDFMNRLMQHALQAQKDNEQMEKDSRGD